MAKRQHLFLENFIESPRIQNYTDGHYYDSSNMITPKGILKNWKGSGYADIQSINIARYKGVEDMEEFQYKNQNSINQSYCFLQIMLDLPRFDMPIIVYRGLKNEIDAHLKSKFKIFDYYNIVNKPNVEKAKKQFILDRYSIGQIIPIFEFISVGLIINAKDNYLTGISDKDYIDKELKKGKNMNNMMLKINIPKYYPFFSYYAKPGDSSNKSGYGAFYVPYDKDGLELSEVILPYTNDRTGNSLTHGYLVKNITYNAIINDIQIYALIEVDIIPLKLPIRLTDVSQWGNDKHSKIPLYNPFTKDKVGDKIFNASNGGTIPIEIESTLIAYRNNNIKSTQLQTSKQLSYAQIRESLLSQGFEQYSVSSYNIDPITSKAKQLILSFAHPITKERREIIYEMVT